MKADVESVTPAPFLTWARSADFLELTKPRITSLILATTMVGFYLGTSARVPLLQLFNTLLGTALVAAGASAFNMWRERERDSRMHRTLSRPLPAGRLQAREALLFATLISSVGIVYLLVLVNALASVLAAGTLLMYLFVYTPLKTRTWLCTLVGAVPGAVPPLIGWAAAAGELSLTALILFAIVFFWQIPHFYAIAWMFRDDYARAGFPMLPVIDENGSRTGRQVNLYIVGLVLVTLIPSGIGLAGSLYLAGAAILGLIFLAFGLDFLRLRDRSSAVRLFIVSVCYLPVLMALLAIDKIPH